MHPEKKKWSKKFVLRTIIALGMMSLFANMAYEGSRAIIGPYLASVGATGTIVGFVAGASEFLGHILRLLANYFSDKKKLCWNFMFLGYGLNLIVLPGLAFMHQWFSIAAMVLLERLGRASRSRPRDHLISMASERSGIGLQWGNGIHASLNQIGRVLGPLLVAVVLYASTSHQSSFLVLGFPVLLSLIILFIAHRLWLHSGATVEGKEPTLDTPVSYPAAYKPFIIGTTLIAFGYADFALISFHLAGMTPAFFVPILYAIAMSMEGIFGIILGILFDTQGTKVLIFSTYLSAFSAPFLFYGEFIGLAIGVILWGIGMSAQNILMKACITSLNKKESRRAAYGIFDISFGFSWFIGSMIMGVLYDYSLTSLVALSILSQLIAIPFLYRAHRLTTPLG